MDFPEDLLEEHAHILLFNYINKRNRQMLKCKTICIYHNVQGLHNRTYFNVCSVYV